MFRSFVLGNGRSRLEVKLTDLKKHGTIYGCNALYRDFEPDYLIAVDPKMIIEICQTDYQLTHEVWTNPNNSYKNLKNLKFFKNPRGWSSGPTALYKSCIDGYKEIYILGFDYVGINEKFNNVYADTPNYKRSIDRATYCGNWLTQTETLFGEFKHTMFYRVTNDKSTISNWREINNLRQINYNEMWRKLENYS